VRKWRGRLALFADAWGVAGFLLFLGGVLGVTHVLDRIGNVISQAVVQGSVYPVLILVGLLLIVVDIVLRIRRPTISPDLGKRLPGVQGTMYLHTGPPTPLPKFELEVRVQSPQVFIAVIAAEPIAIRAQVLEVQNVRVAPATPWTVPWREGGPDERKLQTVEAQLLALGRGDGMGNLGKQKRIGARERTKAGLFHFRTADGEVTAELTGIGSVRDLYGQTFFRIRLRVYCNDQPEDYAVHVGFANANDESGALMVKATLAPWEEPPAVYPTTQSDQPKAEQPTTP
jgi:hypothetical protein